MVTHDGWAFPLFPRPQRAAPAGPGHLPPGGLNHLQVAPSCAALTHRFASAAAWNIVLNEYPSLSEFEISTSGEAPPISDVPPPSGYVLAIRATGACLKAADRDGFISGLQSLWQLSQWMEPIPEAEIVDRPLFRRRAFQMDLARQPETADEVMRIIRQQARFHYNEIQLYVENAIRLPSFGDAADPDGLSMDDYRRIQNFAADLGLRVVPSLNLLGHMEKILAHPSFRHMAETSYGPRNLRQNWSGDLCPALPESRDFIRRVIAEICQATDAPLIMAGLDECWTLGSHPLTRPLLDPHAGAGPIFAEWIRFLHDQFASHGKQMWMWEDMLFYHAGALEGIPRDIGMNIWHYQHIEEYPMYSFQNWRRRDSVPEIASRGHPFILCCGPDLDHLHSLVRYGEGYDPQGLLVVQWEGRGVVQEIFHAPRALASQILWSGDYPDTVSCAKAILCGSSEPSRLAAEVWERQAILPRLASGGTSACPRFWSWPANARLMRALRNQLSCLDAIPCRNETLDVERVFLTAQFVAASCDWARENAALAGRRMLQTGAGTSRILDQAVEMLSEAACAAEPLPAAARALEQQYAARLKPRAMVPNLSALRETARRLAADVRRFRENPSCETWPFVRVSVHVDGFAMDLCSHELTIEAGRNPEQLAMVFHGRPSQNDQGDEFVTSCPLEEYPRFVKVTVTGFASLALTRVRVETLETTRLANRVAGSGGYVRDPDHLLTFDRKAAIFNPPDVLSQWLSFDPPPVNWVLLEF